MNTTTPGPRGIGGWLILPLLGNIISPLINLKGAADLAGLIVSPGFAKFTRGFQNLVIAELVIAVAMIAGWGYALVLMFKHKKLYPAVFNGLLLFTLFFGVAELSVMYPLYGLGPDAASVSNIVGSIVSCAIWIPYMVLSRRVRNTFVH